MIFRIRYRKAGGHIHCRWFEARDARSTFAKNGDLVFDERSWAAFLEQTGRTAIEVIPDDDPAAAMSVLSAAISAISTLTLETADDVRTRMAYDGPANAGGRFDARAHVLAAAPDVLKALRAASHALMSYYYGNAAKDLAKEIALECERAIAIAEGR